ncbi:hypothetical protein Tco_0760203 [Tanacetum coccineum]
MNASISNRLMASSTRLDLDKIRFLSFTDKEVLGEDMCGSRRLMVLGRGTRIRLHLREETGEYLEESKLKVSADEDDSSGEDEKPIGATDGKEKKEDSDKEEDEEKLKNTIAEWQKSSMIMELITNKTLEETHELLSFELQTHSNASKKSINIRITGYDSRRLQKDSLLTVSPQALEDQAVTNGHVIRKITNLTGTLQ